MTLDSALIALLVVGTALLALALAHPTTRPWVRRWAGLVVVFAAGLAGTLVLRAVVGRMVARKDAATAVDVVLTRASGATAAAIAWGTEQRLLADAAAQVASARNAANYSDRKAALAEARAIEDKQERLEALAALGGQS